MYRQHALFSSTRGKKCFSLLLQTKRIPRFPQGFAHLYPILCSSQMILLCHVKVNSHLQKIHLYKRGVSFFVECRCKIHLETNFSVFQSVCPYEWVPRLMIRSGYSGGKLIKSPRPLCAAFVREHYLIMDKHTEILVCIPCVMVLLLHSASRAQISTATCQTVQKLERKQTNGQTDGRYQTYYLPGFAVDNHIIRTSNTNLTLSEPVWEDHELNNLANRLQ